MARTSPSATVGAPIWRRFSPISAIAMQADIEADRWLATARKKLAGATLAAHAEQIGRVEEVGDGIALVSGLPDIRLDELVRFDKGQFGFAQMLERDRVGCVLLDEAEAIEAGDAVRGMGD